VAGQWVNAREIIFIAQQRSIADKRASIRTKLQQFYVESGPLLNRDLPKDISEADFKKYEIEVNTWVNMTAQWIQQNLGNAALAKFTDIGSGFSFSWNRAINEKHNNIINYLTRFRQNLSILIESGAWDAVKASSDDAHKAK
jgi:hypothetical protein